jgi:uncharacterized protein YdeI (YjbR/CyaY-like superfamily)
MDRLSQKLPLVVESTAQDVNPCLSILNGFRKKGLEHGVGENCSRMNGQLPADLDTALGRDSDARDALDKLSPAYRREIADWIEKSSTPEQRSRRIEVVIKLLLS